MKLDLHCHYYFAPPGAGKTTIAVKMCKMYMKKGIKVYTNFPLKGAFKIDPKAELGKKHITNAYICIDEAGIVFNNRDFKTFPKHVMDFFKYHRHYKCTVDLFSQGAEDCDKKIRDISTVSYMIKRIGPFTVARKCRKTVMIDDISKQLIDAYEFAPLLSNAAIKVCFRPRYYKYFNSWDAPELEHIPDVEW